MSVKEYKHVIKEDLELDDSGDVYSPIWTPEITNGRQLIRVYWNDDDDDLIESKTLTLGIGNATRDGKSGIIFKVLTGASGDTAVKKGDLLGEFIVPPSIEQAGLAISIWARSDVSGSGLTGKDIKVQVSGIF